jgi:hypothetical protein
MNTEGSRPHHRQREFAWERQCAGRTRRWDNGVKTVGNYGEVLRAKCRDGKPHQAAASVNALWSARGLMFAPP